MMLCNMVSWTDMWLNMIEKQKANKEKLKNVVLLHLYDEGD